MDEHKKKVKGPDAIAALGREAVHNSLRSTIWAVNAYLREKRILAKKLEVVRTVGKMYRDQLSGDYARKLDKMFDKLAELGVKDIVAEVDTRPDNLHMNLTCSLNDRTGTISVYEKRYGPECWVYVRKLGKEPWHTDLALHIKFGSKNMLVQNRLLDIAMGR
jgi:hypothetical protein